MSKIKLNVVTPDLVSYSGEIDMVVMPGSDGELGVMFGHAPMIVQLIAGEVRVYNDSNILKLQVQEGFAKIDGACVDILSSY